MTWRIFFLKNHIQIVMEKLIPGTFFLKSKLRISLDQQSDNLHLLLLLYVHVADYQNILKLMCWSFAFTSYKVVVKKEIWTMSPHLIFSMIFFKKNCLHHTLLTDQISISDCLYFLRYWVICVLQLFVSQ